MALTDAHRQYLARDQTIGPFVINFVLNAVIPWLMFKHLDRVSVWGDPGVVGDVVATMVILPILVCVIATPLIRKMCRDGKVPALQARADVPAWIMRLPGNLLLRALVVGIAVALLVSPVVVGLLAAVGLESVGVISYALAKGVLCGLVAAVISPPIALRAMADEVAPVAHRAVLDPG